MRSTITTRRLAELPARCGRRIIVLQLVYAPLAAVRGRPAAAGERSPVGRRARRALHRDAFFLFALIAEVGPVRATVIMSIRRSQPFRGDVGEHVTWGMGIGFVLVLIGCVLATGRNPETVAES
jgi:hypothetical protein